MSKITYLLGAGASANAIPTVKSIPGLHKGFCVELKDFFLSRQDIFLHSGIPLDTRAVSNVKDILELAIKMGTPDLLAKYFVERRDTGPLIILKLLISAFIVYLEKDKGCFDYRALSFLAYISSNSNLSKNIQIISWNYDRQLETAAKMLGYSKVKDSVIGGFSCWPNLSDGEKFDSEPFLLHLNGIAGFIYSKSALTTSQLNVNEISIMQESMISYAWERHGGRQVFEENRLSKLIGMASQTNTLVIIGYSFPFFNREFDNALFESCYHNLERIYVQDPNDDGKRLEKLFDLNPKVKDSIVQIADVDSYFIPRNIQF